jgi:glycosyltransferase involved in cell wall biosynthesis
MTPATKPSVVIFFNDWQVFPNGVNSGGGESATLALARGISALGYRVIACANLPGGDTVAGGIEFWDFGADYAIHRIETRLREIGPYYCLCATLAHPLLFLREHRHCLARIIINHSPGTHPSGLEPSTIGNFVDYVLCVSTWQRELLKTVGANEEKLGVVKNGFDPTQFPYSGPENRDWNQLVFIGRVEAAKGIHLLVHVFGMLKAEFPGLKLAVFGDDERWTEFSKKKDEYMTRFPGLVFHGKVPQSRLSDELRRAGLLVFPSISPESAGLAVIEAQASGCPVIAFNSGGVCDYVAPKVGEIIGEVSPENLREGIARMLRDPSRLAERSRAAKAEYPRTWEVVAREVVSYCEMALPRSNNAPIVSLPESAQRVGKAEGFAPETLLVDHDSLLSDSVLPEALLQQILAQGSTEAWPYFVRGLRLEGKGDSNAAVKSYIEAAVRASAVDWQPFFRLAMLHVERKEFSEASRNARAVLERTPRFPLRKHLERIIELAS